MALPLPHIMVKSIIKWWDSGGDQTAALQLFETKNLLCGSQNQVWSICKKHKWNCWTFSKEKIRNAINLRLPEYVNNKRFPVSTHWGVVWSSTFSPNCMVNITITTIIASWALWLCVGRWLYVVLQWYVVEMMFSNLNLGPYRINK